MSNVNDNDIIFGEREKRDGNRKSDSVEEKDWDDDNEDAPVDSNTLATMRNKYNNNADENDGDDDVFFADSDEENEDNDDARATAENHDNSLAPAAAKAEATPLPLLDTIPTISATDAAGTTRSHCTRFVLMSDTHGCHRRAALACPAGDVLIHAGDMTKRGEPRVLADLAGMFRELQQHGRFAQVICIAGNHDLTLQPDFYDEHWPKFTPKGPFASYGEAVQELKHACTYLEDESTIVKPGCLQVYGSPWTQTYGDWAFTDDDLTEYWQDIPRNNIDYDDDDGDDDSATVDVLITHGPAHGRGDRALRGGRVGCRNLLDAIQTRVRPRLHVFGHIHEERGWVGYDGHTLFVNAANVDRLYRVVQPCLVVDVSHDKTQPARWVQAVSPVANLQEFLKWLSAKNNATASSDHVANHAPTNGNNADDDEDYNFNALLAHLRGLYSDMDEIVNWQQPWAEQTFADVACAWSLHRDEKLRDDLRRAFHLLYRDSFP